MSEERNINIDEVKNFYNFSVPNGKLPFFKFHGSFSTLVRKLYYNKIRLDELEKIKINDFFETNNLFCTSKESKIAENNIVHFANSEYDPFSYSRIFFATRKFDECEELSKEIGIDKEIIRTCLNDIDNQYRVYYIWKDEAHTKKRFIEAPNETLKMIQKAILWKVLYKFPATKYAHGFIHGKSIATNAIVHSGKKYVLKMDFKNFFPSISQENLFVSFYEHLNKDNFNYIFTALKLCCFKGRLPQGAPTSPALSNIYCTYLDLFLGGIAESLECNYTRYADDIIFSSDDMKKLKTIAHIVSRNINAFGLNLNKKKTSLICNNKRQTVTGLVVNKGGQCSVRKSKRMKLRAFLHNILTGKIDPHSINMNRLKGNVAIINMANPKQGKYFLERLHEVEAMI